MKRHLAWTSITALVALSMPGAAFGQNPEDPNHWYVPSEADVQLKPAAPPAPPAPPRKRRLVSLQMPLYKFVGGGLEGGASSFRLRYDGAAGGIYLGLYQPGGWLDVGADLNILGGTSVFTQGPVEVWALFPTTGIHVLSDFKDVVFGLPFTVSGIRVTTCQPTCIVADLRGPTADLLVSPASGGVALGLGASLAVGLAF